jgi:ABC-type xylose transport system substrate-binding protein
MCTLGEPTGAAVAELAQQKGVALFAYDRAIFQASHTCNVSFDNEKAHWPSTGGSWTPPG